MGVRKLGEIGRAACLAIVFANLTYIFGMLAYLGAEEVFTDVYVSGSSTTYVVSLRAFALGAVPALALTYLVHKLDERFWRRDEGQRTCSTTGATEEIRQASSRQL